VIGPVSLSILVAIIAASFGAGFLSRRRQEARARLLEVLARAVAADRPLPPLLNRIASEVRGGAVSRIDAAATAVGKGFTLSEAFGDAGRGLLHPRDVEAIRYAEDGPTLGPVLAQLAADAGRAITFRHRIGLALAYPILLTPIFVFTYWSMARLSAASSVPDLALPDLSFLLPYLPFVGVAMLGSFVLLMNPSFARLRPKRLTWVGRHAAESRLYDLAAIHLDAGRSLPDALRRAGEGAGRRSVRRRAERAAARVSRGESLPEVWPWFPAAGDGLAGRLRRVADLRRERHRNASRRRIALIHPVTISLFAAVTFLQFRWLVVFYSAAFARAMPW
jgi:type II secretory pathway component PulF